MDWVGGFEPATAAGSLLRQVSIFYLRWTAAMKKEDFRSNPTYTPDTGCIVLVEKAIEED
jgi:hypothetical protein